MQFLLDAGNHRRYFAPVWVPLKEMPHGLPSDWKERVEAGSGTGMVRIDEVRLPAQVVSTVEGKFLVIIIPSMEAHSQKVCEFVSGDPQGPQVKLVEGEGHLELLIQDVLFSRYVYSEEFAKPYWGPLQAPGVNSSITRLDLETKEHPHQRSLWFSHGDVNGVDVWNEAAGKHGKEVHQDFTHMSDGGVLGYFAARNIWTDFGGNPLLADRRSMVLYNLWEGQRMMDLSLTLQAQFGPVDLGATKEAGPLGIRVAAQMSTKGVGRIVNAYGGISEAECWGKRAPWCDYSGTIEGHQVGIAVFDHPTNMNHPTFWHVRDYGLMAPNNFFFLRGLHLESGEEIAFRYRVFLHAGDCDQGQVGARYHDYVTPIQGVLEAV